MLVQGQRPREVSVLDPEASRRTVAIEEVDPIGTIAIRGPGAGLLLAGQGVFSDPIALATLTAARWP